MIEAREFLEVLIRRGLDSFFGVPDSLLRSLNAEISQNKGVANHVICANEGGAIASAVGHFIGTGKPAVVYLQNSGLGNTVNPLLSIADGSVYGIPMLLIIGWRGEPDQKDEPQHMRQGELTPIILEEMGVSWKAITEADHTDWNEKVQYLLDAATTKREPVALLVGKNLFQGSSSSSTEITVDRPTRESALELVLSVIPKNDPTVATTGMLGRELYEIRRRQGGGTADFLNIGGMGHASSIALGLSLSQPGTTVWCLDGDGAAIMHLGSLAVIANNKPRNLKHIIFNNEVHDSVGGQPTAAQSFSFVPLAYALGYENAYIAESPDDILRATQLLKDTEGPTLLEIKIRPGSRKDLGRPDKSPRQLLDKMMDQIVAKQAD